MPLESGTSATTNRATGRAVTAKPESALARLQRGLVTDDKWHTVEVLLDYEKKEYRMWVDGREISEFKPKKTGTTHIGREEAIFLKNWTQEWQVGLSGGPALFAGVEFLTESKLTKASELTEGEDDRKGTPGPNRRNRMRDRMRRWRRRRDRSTK
jgi:hypothetical protein